MRNNIDDQGGPIISTINCVVAERKPGSEAVAQRLLEQPRRWCTARCCTGASCRSLSANIDVVAHEIFHGVTDHTSRLEYAFQPGALNESYSDIFGTIIANQGNADPRTWDWRLGEGLLPGDEPFRDLSDPPRFGQPDHMDDFKVLPNNQQGDWGGVHINSGIHNKAAYNLLTAENGDGSCLTPPRCAAVFYLALTQRLSRTSTIEICGVLTYVGVLEEMGTIDWVGENVASIGVALLAALLLCYVGAIVSAFASSVGVLGAFIPLSVPFLLQGEVGAVGTVAALAVASTVVDVSPYSTNGALVLANAKGVDQDAFYKKLLIYGAIVVAVAPLLLWLGFVVIGG